MANSVSRQRRVSPGSLGLGTNQATPASGPPSQGKNRVSNRDERQQLQPNQRGSSGDIQGRVLSPDREPLAGATVAVTAGPTHRDIAAVSDEGGHFILGDMLPGKYQMTAHSQGYQPQSIWVDVPSNQIVTLVLPKD